MVYFLVARQPLEHLFLDRACLPVNCPVIGLGISNVPEPVVFQSVPNYFYVVIVQIKVVSAVWWLIWPDRDRVLVRPKNQEILADFVKLLLLLLSRLRLVS